MAHSQNTHPTTSGQNTMPRTPEAAELGKYAELPVSLYTGVPSIDIPLFTLPGPSLSVPIGLRYHGSAVRLDEAAPWTGMGWTLQAGGAITRSCRGTDDFTTASPAARAWAAPLGYDQDCRLNGTDYTGPVLAAFRRQADLQPDLFSFNFMGYTGQLMFDRNGKACLTPRANWVIQAPAHATDGWAITTDDGTRYEFGPAGAEQTTTSGAGSGISAWYLTRIVPAKGGPPVRFFYGDYTALVDYPVTASGAQQLTSKRTYLINSSDGACGSGPQVEYTQRPALQVYGKYLRRIDSGPYRVYFTSSANRPDLPAPPSGTGARRLDRVVLKYLPDSSRVREFALGYAQDHRRLWLTSVQEGPVNGPAKPPHRFAYQWPALNNAYRGSYNVDWWGFYNGAQNTVPWASYTQSPEVSSVGADRRPDPEGVLYGLLKTITYPTGGTTTLAFEPHDFAVPPQPVYDDTDAYANACIAETQPDPTCGTNRTAEFTLQRAQDVDLYLTVEGTAACPSPVDWSHSFQKRAADGTFHSVVAAGYDAGQLADAPGRATGTRYQQITLEPGTYRFSLALQVAAGEFGGGGRNVRVRVDVNYVTSQLAPGVTQIGHGGGVRIKRVVTNDGMPTSADLVTDYCYTDATRQRSTGRLFSQPQGYVGVESIPLRIRADQSGLCAFLSCKWFVQASSDPGDAGMPPPAVVGYDSVTVLKRDGASTHKSVSVFRNEQDAYETNGLLLAQKDYAVPAGADPLLPATSRLVRKVTYVYDDDLVHPGLVDAVRVDGSLGNYDAQVPGCPSAVPCMGLYSARYLNVLSWWPLVQQTETVVDPAGRPFTTVTRTFYDDTVHLQPTRREATASHGETLVTRLRYAPDYAPGTDPGIDWLRSRHVWNAPLEQQQWRRDAANAERWIGGTLAKYPGAGWPLPSQVYTAVLTAPAAAAPAYTSAAASPFYRLQTSLGYHTNGQLAQQQLTRDAPVAYLWDYGKSLPVAEVKNAAVNQVAYTSFEADMPGQVANGSYTADPDAPHAWQHDPRPGHVLRTGGATGRAYYHLDGGWGVGRGNLPAGPYELTLYVRGPLPSFWGATELSRWEGPPIAQGWRLCRLRFEVAAGGSVNFDSFSPGGADVDEVRLCPVGAQMTTFTHDPLAGVTSSADATALPTYFEYDELLRLHLVRDAQGRIVKSQSYHYKPQ